MLQCLPNHALAHFFTPHLKITREVKEIIMSKFGVEKYPEHQSHVFGEATHLLWKANEEVILRYRDI